MTNSSQDPKNPPNWWTPPGMTKKFCPRCRHWFSGMPLGPATCPECTTGRNATRSDRPRKDLRLAP